MFAPWLPLAPLPTGQRARIDAEHPRHGFLRKAVNTPPADQGFSGCVRYGQGVIAKEGDYLGVETQLRTGSVVFPVGEASLVHADLGGNVALEKPVSGHRAFLNLHTAHAAAT